MLNSWLRAANPFNAPRGMLEAERAGRVMVFGLLASSLMSVIHAAASAMHPEWMATLMNNQYARMGLSGQELETQQAIMSAIMGPLMTVGYIIGVVIYLVLAWAQWKYVTRAIPIILLAMTAYSALMAALALATGQYSGLGMDYVVLVVTAWVVNCVCILLCVASMRGAWMFHRLKQEP